MKNDKAEEALKALVTTINDTGGLTKWEGDDRYNNGGPAVDPDWLDLGDAYLLACEALGVEPQYAEEAS